MKNKKTITYSLLSIAGICAVIAIVFAASAAVAHGQVYGYPYYQYPIVVSCNAAPTSVNTGDAVNWYANATGGTGSYTFYWSGDEGLSASGANIMKSYFNVGMKYASVTVTSGNQTVTKACTNSVYVSAPYYVNPVNYYAPLQVTCNTNSSYNSVAVGSVVGWFATVSGGNGSYIYNWTGTDGLSGFGQSISYTYNTPGTKLATVIVTSANQTISAQCINAVNVNYPALYNQVYTNQTYQVQSNNNASGLDISCYPDPSSTSVNQPVTWNATVSGGATPYTYSWTGSDGLSGTQNSVIKYYSTSGDKTAIVSVTSADGRSGVRACTSALSVRSTGGTYVRPATTETNVQSPTPANQAPAQVQQNGTQLSAASSLSIGNIPWGWVALLVILVLFFTVLYLLFNRQKI